MTDLYNNPSVSASPFLSDILNRFESEVPNPNWNNIFIQLGCHLDKVAKMLQTLGDDSESQAISELVTWYKRQQIKSNSPRTENIESDKEILDNLCDQIVTALGIGYMFGFDMEKALTEVSRNIFSPIKINGSDLCRDMLDEGARRVYGYASNDKDIDYTGYEVVVKSYTPAGFITTDQQCFKYFTPADINTGASLVKEIPNNAVFKYK